MLLKDFKKESQLPNPIYQFKPYVVLSKENVILSAGTFNEILSLLTKYGDYYANCTVNIRQYDLYMNDNTKIMNDNSKNRNEVIEHLKKTVDILENEVNLIAHAPYFYSTQQAERINLAHVNAVMALEILRSAK